MSDTVYKEHALTAFMFEHGSARVAAPGVKVDLQTEIAHVSLRIDPQDATAVEMLTSVIHTPLPLAGCVERGECSIFWLGPREFLITAPNVGGDKLVEKLSRACSGRHVGVTDLSGGQILLNVSGSSVREFLSKASTLDFHEQSFALNQCAQSTFAKAGALYSLREDSTFELVVRRSFADYVARWMLNAGQEFGIVFNQ